MPRSVVVIGVGNGLRGDDAAGLEAVRRLADLDRQTEIDVHEHEGEALVLLDLWARADAVVLVDCMRSGVAAGTINRVEVSSRPLAVPLRGASSHAIGVTEAIELARTLGTLPCRFVVYGVEGATFEAGAELSKAVARAIAPLAGAVRREALALLAHTATLART